VTGYQCDMGEWSQFFQAARARTTDLTPVHVKIGEYLLPHSRDNFLSGGGRETWTPLSPATLTPERRRYGTFPLLKTRALLASMTYVAERLYVDIGSRAKQARAQFFGVRSRNLPARSPFNFLAGVLEPIGDMYAAFILGVN
jgi:hypothetical protein